MKIYGSAESRAEHEEDSWDAIDDDAEGCNQEGISTRSVQTLI